MILVLDNYDSFTYNLVQYLWELGAEVEVVRNDECSVEALMQRLSPGALSHNQHGAQPLLGDLHGKACQGLLIGPGPGTPEDSGVTMALLRAVAGQVPVLGVCLGHQAMAAHFGGKVVRAARIMHGKISPIHHDGRGVFLGLPNPFDATRYHSLIVDSDAFPEALVETARTAEGEVMGLRHVDHAWEGVQFHPESFLTLHGKALLKNWLGGLEAQGAWLRGASGRASGDGNGAGRPVAAGLVPSARTDDGGALVRGAGVRGAGAQGAGGQGAHRGGAHERGAQGRHAWAMTGGEPGMGRTQAEASR